MIRFSCPHCDRAYQLPTALAGLPLLCKGCGQRIVAPADQPAPPPPRVERAALPPPPPPAPPAPVPPKAVPRPEPAPDFKRDEPAIESPKRPEPAPEVLSKRAAKPAPEPEPEPTPAADAPSGLLPFVADFVALVVLLGAGMLLGELLVRKPTGDVIGDAAAAPKFPPVELLLWAAPPLMLALVYLLLAGRGRALGALVRARNSPSRGAF